MASENLHVLITTNMGEIELELDAEKAPITVANFWSYTDSGFYKGTLFHRVIADFMIQGGGMDADMHEKPTRSPIKNEADNGLKNIRGSVAMARTQAVDSATSQFFINVQDNDFLDYSDNNAGYAVFAHVVRGMDVADRISKVATLPQDIPQQKIFILSIERLATPEPKKP